MEEVSFLNGKTRLYGIVGDPIEQVRSPEMVTFEFHRRGLNAVMLPLHVGDADFEAVMPMLAQLRNLDGLIFTIPFKARAIVLAAELGPHAQAVGAINALVRTRNGQWRGEIFDGMGCVEAFSRRGHAIAGRRVMLIGLGGAGAAICAAIAAEQPRSMRLFDLDAARCERMADVVRRLSPLIKVEVGTPIVEGIDILLNASPVGMLGDSRLPLQVKALPAGLVVFDAIVKPEMTPLLTLAQGCGCEIVMGREMMRGQISKIADYFIAASA